MKSIINALKKEGKPEPPSFTGVCSLTFLTASDAQFAGSSRKISRSPDENADLKRAGVRALY